MAAPAPVIVHTPAVPANPAAPIYVDANDSIVGSLPFLGWQPAAAIGGVPMVTLSNSEALAAFAIKCKVDRAPAAMPAHAAINPLTLKMTAGAWSRILSAVRDNGLLQRTVAHREALHAYICEHVPIVIIGAVDWAATPPLNLTGSNAASRAAAARIRFIGLANVASLEVQTGAPSGVTAALGVGAASVDNVFPLVFVFAAKFLTKCGSCPSHLEYLLKFEARVPDSVPC